MAKTELFSKLNNPTTQSEFSRGFTNENELCYQVTVKPASGNISFTMKKNSSGHWGIQDRAHLPPWVINLEPEFIRAIKENEA
jgi:hypothetical protein